MSYNAYLLDDAGRPAVPETPEEWLDWVSAGRTRNFALGDPLLDWLGLFGEANGFVRDDLQPGFDSRTDFLSFVFEKGHAFEAAVVEHLATRYPLARICAGPAAARSLEAAEETWRAMIAGAPIIHQAVLRNPERRTYGAADLLVRNDVLAALFPESANDEEMQFAAPALGGDWHYRVVDVKFSALHLDKHGHAPRSRMAYMAQAWVYNEALGRIQGYEPPSAYLLGRSWEQGKERNGPERRGSSCMERLARVDHAFAWDTGSLSRIAADAVEWVRQVRREGASWGVLPRPSVPELWPNLKNPHNAPWSAACKTIGEKLEDITATWRGGLQARIQAHAQGIERWTDPRCTAAALGITGATYGPAYDAILDVNRDSEGPAVRPAIIRAEVETWGRPAAVEFFVDFETVSSLDDGFTRIPEMGGQDLIFMIGCGHIEGGAWQFRCFTTHDLSEAAEAAAIEEWLAHMQATRVRLAPTVANPVVYHWSPAERASLSTALASARARHGSRSLRWREPNWFDFLNRVVKDKAEPVVVRGAMGFGLKAIAKALHSHGPVQTLWGNSVTDGLGAMVGAWTVARESAATGAPLIDHPLMQEIAAYNEVDCRVMMETIAFLRGRAAVPHAVG